MVRSGLVERYNAHTVYPSAELNSGSGFATAEWKFTTPKMEAAGSYGTFVTIYQIERRHISEKLNISLLEKLGYQKCSN